MYYDYCNIFQEHMLVLHTLHLILKANLQEPPILAIFFFSIYNPKEVR